MKPEFPGVIISKEGKEGPSVCQISSVLNFPPFLGERWFKLFCSFFHRFFVLNALLANAILAVSSGYNGFLLDSLRVFTYVYLSRAFSTLFLVSPPVVPDVQPHYQEFSSQPLTLSRLQMMFQVRYRCHAIILNRLLLQVASLSHSFISHKFSHLKSNVCAVSIVKRRRGSSREWTVLPICFNERAYHSPELPISFY